MGWTRSVGQLPGFRLRSCKWRLSTRWTRLAAICAIAAAAAVSIGGDVTMRATPAEILDELIGDLFEEARGNAHLGHIVAVAAAIVSAGEDERVHGARHADVAEAAFLFEFLGIMRVRECGKRPSSSPARKTSGNSRPLAAWRVISVTRALGSNWSVSEARAAWSRNSARVSPRTSASWAALASSFRFSMRLKASGDAFGFESFDVAGAIDEEANEFGKCGGIAGFAESFFGCSSCVGWSLGGIRSQVSKCQGPGAPRFGFVTVFGIWRKGALSGLLSAKGEKWLASSSGI